MKIAPTPSRNRGFSLVELMISVALGMIITAVVAQTYLGTKRTFRAQDNASRIQENARYAMHMLEHEIRMAGFPGVGQESMTGLFNLPVGNFVLQGQNDVAIGAPSPLTTDTISVTYFGAGPAGTPDGSSVNCLGQPVDVATQTTDTFYVAPDPAYTDANGNAVSALWCATNNTIGGAVSVITRLPIVHGVTTMQILYGEDTDAVPDRIANHWVAANAVGLVFDNVVAVRVSLLMEGPDTNLVNPTASRNDDYRVGSQFYHFTQSYADFATDPGAVTVVPGDKKQRVLYHATIGIRNRI